jgi:hypothetical protein
MFARTTLPSASHGNSRHQAGQRVVQCRLPTSRGRRPCPPCVSRCLWHPRSSGSLRLGRIAAIPNSSEIRASGGALSPLHAGSARPPCGRESAYRCFSCTDGACLVLQLVSRQVGGARRLTVMLQGNERAREACAECLRPYLALYTSLHGDSMAEMVTDMLPAVLTLGRSDVHPTLSRMVQPSLS